MDGGISLAWTVTVNGVMTCGMARASACAFVSVQGFCGDGEGLLGQSKLAMLGTLTPGLKVTVICCGGGTKEAETAIGVVMVTTHVPVPEHGPLQPPNTVGAVGAAVKVTCVPAA